MRELSVFSGAGGASGAVSFWVGKRSDMSNLTNTARRSLPQESKTESSMMHQSSAISEFSLVKGTPTAIKAWLISLQRDSHANRSASPVNVMAVPMSATCGPKRLKPYAELDRHSRCWRTFQACLFTTTFKPFSGTWSRQGLMQDGKLYPLDNAGPHLEEKDYGFSAGTLSASDWIRLRLPQKAILASTYGASRSSFVTWAWKHLERRPVPVDYETLMMWPIGASAL